MRKILNNKKGAEMAIGTLVVIVLAVIVLVVIALGFGMGWGSLWSKMTGFFSNANVDSTVQACSYACTTEAQYDFCELKRKVIAIDGDGKKEEPITRTCNQLASEHSSDWGFEPCPAVSCVEVTTSCQEDTVDCTGLDADTTCTDQAGCLIDTTCKEDTVDCTGLAADTTCTDQAGCVLA